MHKQKADAELALTSCRQELSVLQLQHKHQTGAWSLLMSIAWQLMHEESEDDTHRYVPCLHQEMTEQSSKAASRRLQHPAAWRCGRHDGAELHSARQVPADAKRASPSCTSHVYLTPFECCVSDWCFLDSLFSCMLVLNWGCLGLQGQKGNHLDCAGSYLKDLHVRDAARGFLVSAQCLTLRVLRLHVYIDSARFVILLNWVHL